MAESRTVPRLTSRAARARRGCLAAALALAVAAAVVFPYDSALSEATRLKLGREERSASVAWTFLDFLRLFGKADVLIVLALFAGALGKKQAAASAMVALALVGAVVGPLKPLVGRTRPSESGAGSFPSGDAASAAALVGPFAAAAPATAPFMAAMVAAVAVQRVGLSKHFPSDVLAGASIGLVAGAVALSPRFRLPLRARRLAKRPVFVALAAAILFARYPWGKIRATDYVENFLVTLGPAIGLALVHSYVRLRRRTAPARAAGETPARRRVFAIVLVSLASLFFTATRSSLWDRDEPRFARAAVEMVESGDWLVPTFGGEWRLHKPILIYWLMSIGVRAFGETELAVRLFAPIAAALSLFFTWRIGRRALSPEAALMGVIVLATTPLFLVAGSAATTDAVLLSGILAALATFEAALDRPRPLYTALLALSIGGAALAKGPIGVAVPVLTAVSAAALMRRLSALGEMRFWLALAGGIAIALAWAIPANCATGGELFRQGLGEHVFERAIRAREGHGGDYLLYLPYYLPAIAASFFPWTLFLPAALSATAGGRAGGPRARALLFGWIVPTFLLVTLVATKLPHYALPIFPALALAVGGTVEAARRGVLDRRDLFWLEVGRVLFGAVGIGGGAAIALGAWLLPAEWKIARPASAAGWTLLAVALLALRDRSPRRLSRTVAFLAIGVFTIWAVFMAALLPAVERIKVSKPLAEAIRAKVGPGVPVFERGYDEPSLVFYLGRRVGTLRGESDVAAWARAPGPGVLVIGRDRLASIEKNYGPLGLEEIAAARGFNYSKGRSVNLVAVRKLGGAP
jgi:4-amino-4-deoxy-L-arabinose transferase-like glycosyltransferase/membrane-associated phospholipid phosphatase